MDLTIGKQTERTIEVKLKDVGEGMANALRRIAAGEVPVLAIEHVDFTDNNSGLVDEVLAHRLGMVPLKWSGKYNLPADCKCGGKGCSSCQVELKLEKAGPAMVYAGDFVSDDKNVKPFDPKIPIVELLDVQRVNLTAIAQLGLGKDHAKHQSAVVGFKKVPGGHTLTVESVCGLSAAEVFSRALEILSERAEEFSKEVKKAL